ncbi:C6 domain-containing protein [Caenorhabditis elegans]|uniref:C6 domain-containing protein n=1 Tax=Caenorhabditis elegans TaxID=6239 RepID=Q564Z3_CAEEL|nr:C6 domain-containing protein [Caenorhabditis elegans]CAI79195.1 C6 domain-containing protein [Caenorhabditis elegans]|eukprot:NP_001023986.1 Uncharacterized protein CELE_F56H9.6 [Caenorhabditis elegans]
MKWISTLLHILLLTYKLDVINSCIATSPTADPTTTTTEATTTTEITTTTEEVTTTTEPVTTTTTPTTTSTTSTTTTTTPTTTTTTTPTTTTSTTSTTTTTTPTTTTSTTTTTTTTTTTATPTTTTTTMPPCNPNAVSLGMGDANNPQIFIDVTYNNYLSTTDPVTGIVTSTMTVTCSALNGYNTYMLFNGGQGGPADNQNLPQTISITLVCTSDTMVWNYEVTINGVTYTRAVSSVTCQQAPNVG